MGVKGLHLYAFVIRQCHQQHVFELSSTMFVCLSISLLRYLMKNALKNFDKTGGNIH